MLEAVGAAQQHGGGALALQAQAHAMGALGDLAAREHLREGQRLDVGRAGEAVPGAVRQQDDVSLREVQGLAGPWCAASTSPCATMWSPAREAGSKSMPQGLGSSDRANTVPPIWVEESTSASTSIPVGCERCMVRPSATTCLPLEERPRPRSTAPAPERLPGPGPIVRLRGRLQPYMPAGVLQLGQGAVGAVATRHGGDVQAVGRLDGRVAAPWGRCRSRPGPG